MRFENPEDGQCASQLLESCEVSCPRASPPSLGSLGFEVTRIGLLQLRFESRVRRAQSSQASQKLAPDLLT